MLCFSWRNRIVSSIFAKQVWPLARRTASVSAGGSVKSNFQRLFSSDGSSENSDEEEEEVPSTERSKLEPLEFKNYDVEYLKDLKERGSLQLQPFYQRAFKWSQNQASMWIESILRGYPCLPEITLLKTVDDNEEEKLAVFDGQQRLTSIMLYVEGVRSSTWPKRTNNNESFCLEKLPNFKEYEGKRYKDLPAKQQNLIKGYSVRCAIIPSSWSMADYIDFFKRIQGGGTPMTDHELRRALSQGPFTDLLDSLSKEEVVQSALSGAKLNRDETQQLLLRYFQFKHDPAKFGKPSLAQNGLETMKSLNKVMKAEQLVEPLKRSLDLITIIFQEEERFRRPVPLVKEGEVVAKVDKVWFDMKKVRPPIWDCTVAAFSRDDILRKEKAIRDNPEAIRTVLIELMQTHPAFTDRLRSSDISDRVHLFATRILSIVGDSTARELGRVSSKVRENLINAAMSAGMDCSLCERPLGPYKDHLHIDHIKPMSKGGTNDLNNLQVVHRICNLRKSNSYPV